jgi:hypothetical protein
VAAVDRLYACVGEMSEMPARPCLETCVTRDENETGCGLGGWAAAMLEHARTRCTPAPAQPTTPSGLPLFVLF